MRSSNLSNARASTKIETYSPKGPSSNFNQSEKMYNMSSQHWRPPAKLLDQRVMRKSVYAMPPMSSKQLVYFDRKESYKLLDRRTSKSPSIQQSANV